jgi:peptidoglycan/xylan/chitin deacetylase (PgdA/CDA1 family)
MQRFSVKFGLVALLFTLLAASQPAVAKSEKIALTFDDLPGLTVLSDQSYVNYLNDAILRGLKRHHFPAIGFVNESKLDEIDRKQQIANLEKWLHAGMDLGNHTFSHESPVELGARGYIADIARGEPVTKQLLAKHHQQMRWFRHPYLETGFPEAEKREIDLWLTAHGYRIAPVTIDADDWEWAEPYDDALARHDEPRRRRLRTEYLAYTERMVNWYRTAAHALFGRDISYVMLLHATRLNADCIDDLVAMFGRQRLRGISLAEAMRDPAYRTRDPYVGKDGIEWLERWSLELHKDLPWDSFEDVPQWVHAEYDKVDNDRQEHSLRPASK